MRKYLLRPFFVWFFACITITSSAENLRAHECGPPNISVDVGKSKQWKIINDEPMFVTTYTIKSMGNTQIAAISPTRPIVGNGDGVYTFTGKKAGTTSFTIEWKATFMGQIVGLADCKVTVTVEGSAGSPDISVTKTSIDFGKIRFGTTKKETFRVKNDGTAKLTVSAISSDNASFYAGPSSFALDPGDDQLIEAVYDPATLGSSGGNLTIISDDPDENEVVVRVEGEAAEPDIDVHIVKIPVTIVDKKITGGFTVTNLGNADLNVSDITSSNSAFPVEFRFPANGSFPYSLRPNDVFNMNVNFLPVKEGADSTTITIVSDDPDEGEVVFQMHSFAFDKKTVAVLTVVNSVSQALLADVTEKLENAGNFEEVTVIDVNDLPPLQQLLTFDIFLLFALNDPFGQTTWDLAVELFEAGHPLVVAFFAAINDPDFGKFGEKDYFAINPGQPIMGQTTLGQFDPDHPIMDGVFQLNIGSTAPRPSPGTAHPQGNIVAEWADGSPLVVERNINGVTRVDLGLFLPSADADPGSWNGDGAQLISNSLLYTGGFFGRPEAPDIHALPLKFDNVPKDSTQCKLLRVYNLGNKTLKLTGVTSLTQPFSVSLPKFNGIPENFPIYLGVKDDSTLYYRDFPVYFTPGDTGKFDGALTFSSNDPDEAQLTVALEGEGIIPNITLDFAAKTFTTWFEDNVGDTTDPDGFILQQPLVPGTNIRSYNPTEVDFTVQNPTWFSLVMPDGDDLRFGQPVWYLFLDDVTGQLDAQQANWWPVINGQNYLNSIEDRDMTGERFLGMPLVHMEVPDTDFIKTPVTSSPKDSVCAILVSGEGSAKTEQEAFDFDVMTMQKELTQEMRGPQLHVSNTRLLLNASANEIFRAIDSLKNKYRKIYFYYSGHGYDFGLELRAGGGGNMNYLDLADLLYSTNAKDLCVIIDACYAGAAKKAFSAKSEFKRRNVTILASSREDLTSKTRRVKVSSSGERRNVGAFTWYFSQFFGDDFADSNGDGKTTLTEAFNAVRTLNPILQKGVMNEVMDPQICKNTAVTTSGEANTLVFAGQGLQIEQNVPFSSGANLSVSTGPITGEPMWDDTRVEQILPEWQWSIDVENQTGQFNVNLKFNVATILNENPGWAGNLGVVRREGPGSNWTRYSPTIVNESEKTVTAQGVEDFGDWAIAIIGENATSVDNTLEQIPDRFALMQNYPNPFNPSTTIQFATPQTAVVTITIFDILGKEVFTLIDSQFQAGNHKVIFDAGNLASGMYFYRIQVRAAGSNERLFTATKKLMLLK